MKIEIPDEFFNEEELENTPGRYKKFLKEWLEDSNGFKFTTFKNEGYDQMVIVKDIDFFSMCSHHLLPFKGKCHIGYIPNDRICGLSKIPRVIEKFAHRPQLQERLTEQVAEYLNKELKPKGVIVIMEAEHLCMAMRGIRKPNHATLTSSLKGVFKTDVGAKQEFISLIKR
jgi:GTP cyclohydrolase IA